MEFSSPLAAMQPPPRPTWGCGRDIPNSRPRHAPSLNFGGNNFNFRDLSMKRSSSDYFSLKTAPARGSSPTASLAADLSQNFHIDQSPQLPTPRRSLFTSALFGSAHDGEGATTPPTTWGGATTPPILSSSPGYAGDCMDISPLPHKKAAFSLAPRNLQLEVLPPAAETSDEDMLSPANDTPPRLQVPERKRSQFLRPSLSRTKCLSSTSIGQTLSRGSADPLPTFTFGAGGMGLNTSVSTPSLDEAFKASPPQEKNPFDRNHTVAPRPRSLFHNANASRGNGSPISISVKRVPITTTRPRKQFRRSLSMFESPGDVMKQEKEYIPSGLGSIMDVDEGSGLKLPHFFPADNRPEHGSVPRINHDTMVNVLDGHFNELYESVLIVDCRFEYEYEGGHILGAENYNDKEQLSHRLFESCPTSNALVILHCEYSNHRAPLMAAYLRKQDRAVNAANYPHLSYPDLYILDGGYCSFFDSYRPRCFPQNYLRMDDEAHAGACERGLGKIKQRAKLSRAQTFAFGQGSEMDDSPSRPSINIVAPSEMDTAGTPARVQSRRMVSY